MKTAAPLLFLSFIFTITIPTFSLVRINEIMSSNGTTIADEDGDYPDWVELYNDGNTSVNLDGYTLSDSYEEPQMWRFPDMLIEPDQYLIVWASGKDRTNPASSLHTNFRIAAEGEEILLGDASGRIIDVFSPMSIPRDYSAGRVDEIAGWGILRSPTPGERNNTQEYYEEILSSPRFSVDPGFYAEDTISVELMHDDSAVDIYYTLDGSRPDTSSLMYTAPLTLTAKHLDSSAISFIQTTPDHLDDNPQMRWAAPADSLEMGHVVRAVAWKENHVQSHTVSGSWFVGNAARISSDCAVMSIIADSNDLFDSDSGIYVPGAIYDRRGYGSSPWGIPNANYHQRGDKWEREAHFEFFKTRAQNSIAHGDMSVRIFGSGSRVLPQKSLRLYHRASLVRGEATGLACEFFDDRSSRRYDRLLLRNSGQDWYSPGTMLLDGFLQSLVGNCNVENQAYLPAVVFLNGEYWGIHNLRESIDEHYFARRFAVDDRCIDIIDYKHDAVEGTADSYQALLDYIDEHDISDSIHYRFIQRHIDIDSYIDYIIINTYIANTDWPGNNVICWRRQTEYDSSQAPGRDGRFRWALKDLDDAANYDRVDFDMVAFLMEPTDEYPNPAYAVKLINSLWTNDVFVKRFINSYARLMNTTFHPYRVRTMLNTVSSGIEEEIVRHYTRWGRVITVDEWKNRINRIHQFFKHRPQHVYRHLNEHFAVGDTQRIVVDNRTLREGTILINGKPVEKSLTPEVGGFWSGIFFENEPLTLEVVPHEKYLFSHWDHSEESSAVLDIFPGSPDTIRAHFEAKKNWKLIHLWHFNDASADSDTVNSDYSAVSDAHIVYAGEGEGYMDYCQGIRLNASDGEEAGEALRVRNPSEGRALHISAPSRGFKDVVLSFAVRRTKNGVQQQSLHYSLDNGGHWVSVRNYPVQTTYTRQVFDLTEYVDAHDTADLQFKITFDGDENTNTEGNNRFDNISIYGTELETGCMNRNISERVPFIRYAQNSIVASVQLDESARVEVKIFNCAGRCVGTLYNSVMQPGEHQVRVPLTGFATGVYIVDVRMGTIRKVDKIHLVQ